MFTLRAPPPPLTPPYDLRAELSKSTAISNSDNWTGAPAAEDDGSLDDIPSSTDAFTAAGPGPSSAASDGLHVIEVQKRWLPQLTP